MCALAQRLDLAEINFAMQYKHLDRRNIFVIEPKYTQKKFCFGAEALSFLNAVAPWLKVCWGWVFSHHVAAELCIFLFCSKNCVFLSFFFKRFMDEMIRVKVNQTVTVSLQPNKIVIRRAKNTREVNNEMVEWKNR